MKKRLARAMAVISCGCFLFVTAAGTNPSGLDGGKSGKVIKEVKAADSDTADVAFVEKDANDTADISFDYAQTIEDEISRVESELTDTSMYGYSNLGIADVNTYLNVRQEATTKSAVVGKMADNAACEIEEDLGGWARISSGDVSGYVCTDYLLTGVSAKQTADNIVNKSVTVNTSVLRVREESNTDSQIISRATSGTVLHVAEVTDESTSDENAENSAVDTDVGDVENDTGPPGDSGWIEVCLDDDRYGFVSAEYVTQVTELSTASPVKEMSTHINTDSATSDGTTGNGSDGTQNQPASSGATQPVGDAANPASLALQYVGAPYAWGGTSLSGGSDCSGFVLAVYANFGISLPHSSAAQAGYGVAVSASEAQPGDLFFYGQGGISHVGIYIGNGQIVHSSTPGSGVKISSAFYETPVCVRRLIQ